MSGKRKKPEMTGIFAEAANDFVDYKRSLGFKYEGEPKCLARFCRFATESGANEIEITRSLAEAFTAPTHTSLLIGDGDDLRVQDNHLISNSLWLLLEIEKAATSKIEK